MLPVYIITLSFRGWNLTIAGIMVLVKIQGADNGLKGRQLNW